MGERAGVSLARHVALAACLLGGAGCGPTPRAPSRPNVVLVVLDTLRTDHLSTYGYDQPTSPHLDALAAQGVVFEDCLAQSSWTMPSMISLMTGQPLFSAIYRIPDSMPVMAESFVDAGYRTGGFVANSLVGAEAGFARGFERFDVRQRASRQWTAADVVTSAQAFLDEADDRPFFLWLHFLDTHAPYTPEVQPERRSPEEVFLPEELATIDAVLAGRDEQEAARLAFQKPVIAQEVQRYDAELRELDAWLGRLFDRLDQADLADDTYIVVAADHGETLFRREQHPKRLATMERVRRDAGEALRLEDLVKKEHDGWLFDELVRTPLIVHGPDIPPGRRVEELVTNLDVLPTLTGLCRLPRPSTPGRDLSGALRTRTRVPPAPFAITACSGAMGARLPDGRKLIVPSQDAQAHLGLEEQLYDLRADPLEQHPLPLDAKSRALARRLREAAEEDPFRGYYDAPDEQTMEGLRELGYVR